MQNAPMASQLLRPNASPFRVNMQRYLYSACYRGLSSRTEPWLSAYLDNRCRAEELSNAIFDDGHAWRPAGCSGVLEASGALVK